MWNSYLPHGNGDNYEPTCRLCQYVTMFPAAHEGGSAVPINGYRTALDDEAERQRRIRMWREAISPRARTPGRRCRLTIRAPHPRYGRPARLR